MLTYSLYWLLCDIALVWLHFLDVSAITIQSGLGLLTIIAIGLHSVNQRKICWRAICAYSSLSLFAWWQVTQLPPVHQTPPEPGAWVGRWEGLSNPASALFQPYLHLEHPDADIPADACIGTPLVYRLWIRGLKPERYDSHVLEPGACVLLNLDSEEEASDDSANIFQSWRQRNRIAASMRIAKNSNIQWLAASNAHVDILRLSIRNLFAKADDAEASHHFSYLKKLPVLLGLVTGDRALMQKAHWQLFSNTGTSHLMAISGSHVGMFAVFVYAVVRRIVSCFTVLTTRIPAQHFALVGGWLGALAYSLLAGFNVPTQRTLVMLAVAALCRWRGRSLLDWNSWWMSAVAVTLYDPLAIFDRGAWLSFYAVAIILWLLQGHLRPPGAFKGWWIVQGGIFVGLSPLLAFAFGGFPWGSPVANALAIPVVGYLVVPGAIICTMALAFIPSVAPWILKGVLWIADVLLWFLQTAEKWGGAGYHVPQLDAPLRAAIVTLLALVAVLWLLAPRGFPGKAIALVLILPSLSGPGIYTTTSNRFEWLSQGKRPSFLIEDAHSLWWVFTPGQPAKDRQLLWQNWARRTGYGYLWDTKLERYADWVTTGVVVARYDKVSSMPGQISLKSPVLSLPCIDGAPMDIADWHLDFIREGENGCWLRLNTKIAFSPDMNPVIRADNTNDSILLLADVDRQSQLQLTAIEPRDVFTLLYQPGSGKTLMAALLNQLNPHQVVAWPKARQSKRDPHEDSADAKLAARNIQKKSFSEFIYQAPASPRRHF